MTRLTLLLASVLLIDAQLAPTQTIPSSSTAMNAELKYVVVLSRHGVRSPTSNPEQYNAYSVAPWPQWDVPPGYLTAHGYHLMELFGAYDRMLLVNEGLLSSNGCEDAAHVTFYADSDQRTRETGKALSAGLFPGCNAPVKSFPEGTNDPLFHPHPTDYAPVDSALATAAIAGRIGNDPANVTEAYRAQIGALDTIMATCGATSSPTQKRISLFNLPASLAPGKGDHLVEMRGPLNTASSLAENLLLEYTQGMSANQVGWGCVTGKNLRSLIDLHMAAADFTLRTPAIARVQSSNLLDHILRSVQQAAASKPVNGALGQPADRTLFLIGHDTNLTAIAGLLGLTWIADGRRDDTPPGGALVFELWKDLKNGEFSVRTYFTAQTLEQMRSSAELTLSNPPQRVPVFLPGCSRKDFSCSLPSFQQTLQNVIDPLHIDNR
jgi:4-phytase/acid phosphatase